jgi:Family of unknown function (DUF6200)
MATKGATAAEHGEHHAQREHEAAKKTQLVLVDLSRRQTPKQISRLRKGRGSLIPRIDKIVEELVESGTVKAEAQPVVIIVRETMALPWPFVNLDFENHEDDDDDDDEDEDEDDEDDDD